MDIHIFRTLKRSLQQHRGLLFHIRSNTQGEMVVGKPDPTPLRA